jgi:hypothetical protein
MNMLTIIQTSQVRARSPFSINCQKFCLLSVPPPTALSSHFYSFPLQTRSLHHAQGLGKYLIAQDPEVTKKGVVIGFDGRHNSNRFAAAATAVFKHLGFQNVILFSRYVMTPMVVSRENRSHNLRSSFISHYTFNLTLVLVH